MKARRVKRRLSTETGEIIARGGKIAKELRKNATTYGRMTMGYIKRYPVQSTLIAVTMGMLFGKIFRRR